MNHSRPPLLGKQNITHHESAQVWTATRCHRLLRPLLAHISALRKEKARKCAIDQSATAAVTGTTATLACKRSNPEPATGQTDTCKRRKICNKYSSKASRTNATTPQRQRGHDESQQHRQRLGANKAVQVVAMPTPFLKRVRNHQLSSPVSGLGDGERATLQRAEGGKTSPRSPNRSGRVSSSLQNHFSLETELSGLRRSTRWSEHSALCSSILRALESILRATCPSKTPVAAPRSLMAMCLRKVPEYIAELEYWEKQDARANGTKSVLNQSKVGFDVYSDLESFGIVDGWKQLCVVVRAHSVRILEDAIREGLVDDEITELSIRLCLEHMPETGLSGLVDSFICRQYPDPSHDDDDLFGPKPEFLPLQIIRYCDTPNSKFTLGKLAQLLAGGFLPATWILTKNFRLLWVETAQDMTKRKLDGYHRMMDFVNVTIELLCFQTSARSPKGASDEERREKERAQIMLTSGLAALSSMVQLCQEDDALSENRAARLETRLQHIVQLCINKIERARRATRKDLGIYLLRLCAFLSLNATNSVSAGIEAAWHDALSRKCHEDTARLYDATLGLVAAVAHNCSRGTDLPPNGCLFRLCDKLATLNIPDDQLSNLRVDGAIFTAVYTGNLRDLAFAESLKAASKGSSSRPDTKTQTAAAQNEKSNAAYVWDDDIGEWVISKDVTAPTLAPRRPTRSSSRRPLRTSLSLAECIANFQSNTSSVPSRPGPRSTGTSSTWESQSDDDSSEPSEASESEHSIEDDEGQGVDTDDDNDNSSRDERSVSESDMGSYANHSLPDTPATEVHAETQSPSPVSTKQSRGVRIASTSYSSLPERCRSSLGSVSSRRESKPPRHGQLLQDTDMDDELAFEGGMDSEREAGQPGAGTMKRTRLSRKGLLCMKPVRKPVQAAAREYDIGSSDDELSFM
ncbi:hypothetical protein B0T14DRAFT_515848 [Immersiella caudata]|uniref:Uncharacterized protein n=1 Tax=Immersiella caudata TaxID=314043 RepID=A0AA39WXB3_9PEZI|nr:hypothetical protein B0T14DRAFT_515848 [Immersiella caudata]